MWLNKYLLLILSIYLCFVVNGLHSKTVTCSEKDYCSRFRTRDPANKYAYDPDSTEISPDGNTLTGTLLPVSESDENLVLSIQLLKDSTLRVKIKEVNSNRYELQDVLEKEPETMKINNLEKLDNHIKIEYDKEIITRITYSPFSIEFLRNDIVQLILNGTGLVMENTELEKPFALRLQFPEALQLYGIHDHPDNLALQNTRNSDKLDPYRLRNLGYTYDVHVTSAVYGAVPVLYGHGNSTVGVFLHNAAEQWYDIINNNSHGSEAFVFVEAGTLDLFVMLGPQPADLVRQYVHLTGTGHLPQLWVLGYHQCRYSYESQDDVKYVINNFDSHNFQLDTIWLDIDYTDGFRYWTWNPNTYNNPLDLQEFIANSSRRLVTIIDPHLKADPQYEAYAGALEKDLFVHKADGSVFQGNCWPGPSSWVDFLNPEARDYIASWYSYEKFKGSTPVLSGFWNDMNEPSVFDVDEDTMAPDAIHFGNVKHIDIHNIYGFLQTKATHQGLIQRDNGEKRPFILTRSYFAGSQRYAAIWTGDNFCRWEMLRISYPQCLNANMLGIVLCGADVGGFNDNPTDELFERWYQAGIWLPFFRAHSEKGTNRREPYLFNEDVQNVVRNAIQLRYKHLPLWYTLFYEHVRTGAPLVRPMFYHYPENRNLIKIDDQLFVGQDILVKLVAEPNITSTEVYFPGMDQLWLSINNNDVYEGLQAVNVSLDIQSIPVYYRQGGVIVRKETVRKSTQEMLNDGHTLFVILGNDNTAHGTVYLDDNVSFNYEQNKEYNYLSLDFRGTNLTITKIDKDSNSDKFDFIIDEIIFMNVDTLPKNGKPGSYSSTSIKEDASGTPLNKMKFGKKIKETIKLL